MLGIRQKMSLGFGGLLLITLVVGAQSILVLTRLGGSIGEIMQQNYRSVIACQDMKEALERMDSGFLFTLLGYTEEGRGLIRQNEEIFAEALRVELNNITLPGEREYALLLQDLFQKYRTELARAESSEVSGDFRRQAYFGNLFPLFQRIKETADIILRLNQDNMSNADEWARRSASAARASMALLLCAGTALALGFMFFTGKWILAPIERLAKSADEISRGNLDLVVQSHSQDEIGRLSESFNAMAAALRESRRSDQARLTRAQDATRHAFDCLPDAVAIVDLGGKVEVATEAARSVFGLRPNSRVTDNPLAWIPEAYRHALAGDSARDQRRMPGLVQQFVGGEEHYFRPQAALIRDSQGEPAGVVLAFQDVTQLRQQDEIKRGVISTVSHELKTPLTSIRLAIHLLLEEKAGSLTEKQAELLVAAREESDRLHRILTSLLDIGRIEAGKALLDFRAVPPQALAAEALDPIRRAAQDQGVTLTMEVSSELPEVWADPGQIGHVFGNLLSNAITYTPPGGKVAVTARAEPEAVEFSVSDTGRGISREYLPRVFEQFFRVPDQKDRPGAGLGLAIVKEIVEAHGGKVDVDSREGRGSTFSFTLRRADRIQGEGQKA